MAAGAAAAASATVGAASGLTASGLTAAAAIERQGCSHNTGASSRGSSREASR
jgi:hypothetical protein